MDPPDLLPPRNRLLAALAAPDQERLAPHLLPADWRRNQVLWQAGASIQAVWFPETAVASLRVTFSEGSTLEVGTVGHEGLVGHAVFLGDTTSEFEAVVQVPGQAVGLPTQTFQAELERGGDLRRVVGRAARAFFLQVAQVAACNRLHTADQRLARWLLMTQDRVGAPELPLTHEHLAEMIGANRTTATLALGDLQRAGLVRMARSCVTICDRVGLETAACECYEVTRAHYERLLGGL